MEITFTTGLARMALPYFLCDRSAIQASLPQTAHKCLLACMQKCWLACMQIFLLHHHKIEGSRHRFSFSFALPRYKQE